MKKYSSREAFYERMKELAEVNKTSVKESKTRNLGTLIDYKRAADGVAYGIIKEQHHYYVKKAGTRQDPDVADFAYIGGLSNITDYQYKSLAEAEKQRNFMFCTINEAMTTKVSKTGSKKKINEDKASDEIEQAASKVGDLDVATASAEVPVEEPAPEGGEEEMAAGLEAEPAGEEMPAPEGGEELPAEEPAPEGGEELPEEEPTGDEEEPTGDEEAPADDTTASPEDMESLGEKEIEKSLGKITNKIRKMELEPAQVKSFVNSFLSAFKGKFDDIEIEDRKAMADKILKVVSDDDVEDLSAVVPQDGEMGDEEVPAEEPEVAEEVCAECGGFGKYAESRGYDSPQAFMECGEEEQGNVISGYANAHNDGMNDGDFKMVALVVNPEMLEKLKGEYGHDEYAEKLTPYVNSLSETTEEDRMAQINELWGGLKKAFGKVGGDVKAGAQKAGQAVGGAIQKGAQAVTGAAQKGAQAVSQYAGDVKKAYHTGEVGNELKKLETIAANLGKQVAALNTRLQKAGQQPVNIKGILQTISNQVAKGGTATLQGRYGVAAEGAIDPASVNVQPDMLKEDDEPEEIEGGAGEENEKSFFAPEAQSLGAGVIKPDTTPTTGVDITVQPDKTVNIAMNETEAKLRKYIRNRLEEKVGLRKSSLNESKKSPALKKLDSVIDKQFQLYETVVKKGAVTEKWAKDVKIKKTGEHAGKTIEEINKELTALKKKSQTYQDKGQKVPDEIREKQSELNLAKRAKGGWDESKKVKGRVVDEGLSDYLSKGMNVVNQAIEGKYKKQKALKAAIEADPQKAKNALLNAYNTELMYNSGLVNFINKATPENALQIARQAANDPDGLGKITVRNGVLVYIPAINV